MSNIYTNRLQLLAGNSFANMLQADMRDDVLQKLKQNVSLAVHIFTYSCVKFRIS